MVVKVHMTRNWSDTSLTFSSSALSPNLATMFILYGIVGGIGCGLMFLPTGTTCNYWFKKRRAIANGKYYHKSRFCGLRLIQNIHRLDKLFFRACSKSYLTLLFQVYLILAPVLVALSCHPSWTTWSRIMDGKSLHWQLQVIKTLQVKGITPYWLSVSILF